MRKSELLNIIKKEEADKLVLEKNIRILQEKLGVINNSLLQHKNLCDNYERTIQDTEIGFKKVENKRFFYGKT